jgi:fused signal recognition particle receptor
MDVLTVSVVAAGLGATAAGVGFMLRRRRRERPATAIPVPAPVVAAPDRVGGGLSMTRRRLVERLESALGRGPRPVDVVLAELEEALVSADVGTRTTATLLERVRAEVGRTGAPQEIRRALREAILGCLASAPAPVPEGRPWVILVTGVNGVGKTTTIGKLAARYAASGKRVLMVAADTFRAAASDQLAVWAERTGVALVQHAPGGDPSAVVFDGMKAAVARGIDVVLVDTAGRLHTRTPLIDELRKLRRVIAREVPGAPHETLLVLDATTGQNAVNQARTFTEAVEVTGVILTKLDGTARGGVAVAVRHELGLPIRYIGVGEAAEDLRPFDATEFVAALLGPETPTGPTVTGAAG